MSTTWFNRSPGDFMSPSAEDENMMLVGDSTPDWVRHPSVAGGRQLRVLASHQAACPKCKRASVRHLELEDDYGVAECGCSGFIWYQKAR